MALANFFDKTALAASYLLRGFDREAFAATLGEQMVGLAFDERAVSSAEGRTTIELSANLLARLYPCIAIVPLGRKAQTYAKNIEALVNAINPAIDFVRGGDRLNVYIVVGSTVLPAETTTIYAGSEGWIARVSPSQPVGSGTSANPFGAAAAACFAAANVFRSTFREQLVEGRLDDAFSLSLVELDPNTGDQVNPPLGTVELGEAHLVGLGAIGNGAAWVLSRVPSLEGALHLVDGEGVDLTNLQRYVAALQADVGQLKVAVAQRLFEESNLNVYPHSGSWGTYLRERADFWFERVAVAVDSADTRRAVQAALPRWIVNAWTQTTDLGISRHDFLGDAACLACLYLPTEQRKSESTLVAEAIGLPAQEPRVRNLLYTREAVGSGLLEEVAIALAIPVEPLLTFADKPLHVFYAEAACGGLILRLGGVSGTRAMEVPMVFQSALAGVLLSAELVLHAMGYPRTVPTRSSIDLLRPLGKRLSQPHRKAGRDRCICRDSDYIAAYKAKYPDVVMGSLS